MLGSLCECNVEPNLVQLRQYPIPFAIRLLQVLPQLASQGEGRPSEDTLPSDAKMLFKSLSFATDMDIWGRANLNEVCHFLRGNVNLMCPQEWKQCFPEQL